MAPLPRQPQTRNSCAGVYLDLAGTIPSADAARRFLDDDRPGKRERLIDELLESSLYARRMQNVFDVMLMERRPDKHVPTADWQQYLTRSFSANKPYNQLIREIMGADGADPELRPAAKFFLDRDGETSLLTRDVGAAVVRHGPAMRPVSRSPFDSRLPTGRLPRDQCFPSPQLRLQV